MALSSHPIDATTRAVVFDLFATLVSPDASGFPGAVRGSWEALGVAKADWRAQTFAEANRRLTGQVDDPFEIVRTMAHAIDPSISETRIRRASDERQARFRALLTHVPAESLTVLAALRERGIKTALITNADVIETAAWSDSPLDGMFDHVVFSWQVGVAKPDPAIYRHCLDSLDVPAACACFVGDGGSRELDGARSVGMTTVFTRQYLPIDDPEEIARRTALAHFTVDRLDELLVNG